MSPDRNALRCACPLINTAALARCDLVPRRSSPFNGFHLRGEKPFETLNSSSPPSTRAEATILMRVPTMP